MVHFNPLASLALLKLSRPHLPPLALVRLVRLVRLVCLSRVGRQKGAKVSFVLIQIQIRNKNKSQNTKFTPPIGPEASLGFNYTHVLEHRLVFEPSGTGISTGCYHSLVVLKNCFAALAASGWSWVQM